MKLAKIRLTMVHIRRITPEDFSLSKKSENNFEAFAINTFPQASGEFILN